MRLLITDLWLDPSIQIRGHLDEDAVAEYVDLLAASEPPPIIVFDEANIVGDGFHRIEAALRAGRMDIEAERLPGGRDEALAYAVTANAKGRAVRLTRSERNAGIRRLLDLDWRQVDICEAMGVAQATVSNINIDMRLRASLPADLDVPALTPTHRYRIASLPVPLQEPVARAVVEEGWTEPDTRAVVRSLRDAPPDAGWPKDEVMRYVKGAVRGMNEADPWLALQRVTDAMAKLRTFQVAEVLAAVPLDERSAWLMQVEDLLDYLGRVRDGLGETEKMRTVS